MTEWTAQVNDLVGGWIVTTYPHPLSEHNTYPNRAEAWRGTVIADCRDEADARLIADLLSGRDRAEASRRDWAAEAMRLDAELERERKITAAYARQQRWTLSDDQGPACYGVDGEPGECTSLNAHMHGCPDSAVRGEGQ